MEHQKNIEPSSEAELMLELFDGYDTRYISASGAATVNDKGKVSGKYATIQDALTAELVEKHLLGDATVGRAPQKADSTCTWGVLDIDWYNMPDDDVLALFERLHSKCVAFRTKSRGLHIVVFVDEPVPAKTMHQYLQVLKKRLPKTCFAKGRDVEVFPKATQVHVTPDAQPTAVWFPFNGQGREMAWLSDGTGAKVAFDEMPLHTVLTHIKDHCRMSVEMLTSAADEIPVVDASDMGYKVPHNPAGRNDLLMRIGASMQARGWPDVEMGAELRRLNGDKSFHDLFEEGPITENEIVAMLRQVQKREKGSPAPLHYHQVEKFNRRWSKITINGNVEFLDKEASDFTTFKKPMLFDETSDKTVRVGKQTLPLALVWLRDPDHARYTGVVCEPTTYEGSCYNVWRGFAVAPRKGDASILEDYLLNVLCGGDAGLCHWVTMWLADAVQNPTRPSPPTAIALRGKQGGGKSFLQERILTPIFGERYVQKVQESERLFSRFNRSLFGSTFVAAEESIFHGSKAMAAKLKSFISSPSWTYEEKHKAAVAAKNVHRLIATTNETQAVHLDADDRRWTVIEVEQPFDMITAEGREQAYAFWSRYHDFVKSEDGPSIMLDYFLNYKVESQALVFGYGTAAKSRDKIASDPLISALHEIAVLGVVPHDPVAKGVLSTPTLRALYVKEGGSVQTSSKIGSQLKATLPHVTDCRNARFCNKEHTYVTSEGVATTSDMYDTRVRGFNLGTLAQFREAMALITGETYDSVDLPENYDPKDFGFDDATGWRAWSPSSGREAALIDDISF